VLNKIFGNRYRTIERIGLGGMAEVYRATDEVLGRTVALKLMLPQYAADPAFAARFKHEAQAAANLQSPYIVNIYDWGRDDVDQTFYIAMELVRGTDLKTAINQRGALNQRKAAEIGSQICSALAVAHGYDIIHRDIKPHNIMVQPDGNAKVMDFGIARANGSSMTQTGSVLGTAYYVSPEQAQGKPLTPATDLYSLGVVLYEAVCGRVPFDGPDAVSVAVKQVSEQPLPPHEINPDIDPELEEIILKAMSKDPNQRYATASAMRTALNNYLAGRPVNTGIVDTQAATTVLPGNLVQPSQAASDLGAERPLGSPPIAPTTVLPVTTSKAPKPPGIPGLSAPSKTASHAEDTRRKNRKMAITIGVIAGALVLGFLVFAIIMALAPGHSNSKQVMVPQIIGYSLEEAEQSLINSQLKLGEVTYQPSESVAKGRVISAEPSPSTKTMVDIGSSVNLVVSSGAEEPKQKAVPRITNLKRAAAEKALTDAGFTPKYMGDENSSSVNRGNVTRQDPAAGKQADVGVEVSFYVSSGPATTTVPDVRGKSESEATQTLKDEGFSVTVSSNRLNSDTVPAGNVIDQSISPGTTRERGSSVTITISAGPVLISVPNVVGKSYADARYLLDASGLTAADATVDVDRSSQDGVIIKADPKPGAKVTKGSTVTIYIGNYTAPPEEVTPPEETTTPPV